MNNAQAEAESEWAPPLPVVEPTTEPLIGERTPAQGLCLTGGRRNGKWDWLWGHFTPAHTSYKSTPAHTHWIKLGRVQACTVGNLRLGFPIFRWSSWACWCGHVLFCVAAAPGYVCTKGYKRTWHLRTVPCRHPYLMPRRIP
jgi:hypothetical protein